MKFVYWSGHNKPLELKLRDFEEPLKGFVKSLGINPNNVKISYNYKDQTNKAKAKKKQPIKLSEPEERIERCTVHEYSNGTIAVRLNGKIMRNKIVGKLSPLKNLTEEEYTELAANIELGVVGTYLANYAMSKSPKYAQFRDTIPDEELEPLLPLFLASEIKMREAIFFKNIGIVSDPYFYEKIDMYEAEWMDLFDICNYYRFMYRTNFTDAIGKSRNGRVDSKKKLNQVIERLEKLSEQFYSFGEELKTG